MNNKKPIKIIGAGPAGLCAAINLARAGYPVIVFERNRDAGMRFHGDFQGIENWTTSEDLFTTLRSFSIEPDFLCEPYNQGEFFMKGNVGGTVNSPSPLFYLTLRGSMENSLDQSLKKQALEAGVEIQFQQRRDPQEGDIIATGPRVPNVLASGYLFSTDLPDKITVMLDNQIAPWGYAYLLVRKGQATLATVYYKDFKNGFHYLDKSVKIFQGLTAFSMEQPKRFTGYGCYHPAQSAVENHRLLVGESAGFQDYLFGFGIRYALTSGFLAAKSIIEGLDYDTLWKVSFQDQLITSLSNRYLFQIFGTLAHRFIITKTTSGNPWRFMNRLYHSRMSRWVAIKTAEKWFYQSQKSKA